MGRTFECSFNIYGNLDGKFKNAFSSAGSTISGLQTNIKTLKDNIKLLDNSYKNGTININSYKNAHSKMTATLDNTIAKQEKLARAMKNYNDVKSKKQEMRAGIMDAAESAIVLGAPVKMAMDMESAMADVRKVVDFDTPQQFKEMQVDIVNLSKSIPMAASELAKIVAAGGQSGIAKEDLTSFAESAAKMGVAFDITADEAGEMMAKWRTAFKMNQVEVVDLADKINYLGNNTAASAPKISDVVRRIGPLGEIGGVASGEIAALGASMVGAGIESEVAATGIKNLILGMVAGEGATKSQAGAFAQLGLDATDMAKRMQTDAKGAIVEVLSKIQALDKYQQASVLKELFGSESLSAIAPLLGNLDNLQKNMGLVGDKSKYTGSMQAEFSARIETTEAKLTLAKNSAEAAAMALGNNLLPAVQSLAGWFAKGADALTYFTQEYPTLTSYITYGTAAILGANIAVYAFKYAWLALKTPFSATNAALTLMRTNLTATTIQTGMATMKTTAFSAAQRIATFAQWAWNAAANANPVGLLIAGLVALVGIGYVVYQNFDKIKGFCEKMWDSPAAKLLFFIGGPIGWLIGAGVGIIANWDYVKAWFVTLWENPSLAIDQFCTYTKNKFGVIFTWLEEKWNWIKNIFSTPIEANVQASASANSMYQRFSYANVAANANGGIYGKGAFLTTFAEESAEAAIPLDGSPRAIGLWQQAGQALGMNTGGSSAVFSPNITITGNADNETISSLKQMLSESMNEFERKFNAMQNQRGRVSYG